METLNEILIFTAFALLIISMISGITRMKESFTSEHFKIEKVEEGTVPQIVCVQLKKDYKEFETGTILFESIEGEKNVFDLINLETNEGYTFQLEEILNNKDLFKCKVRYVPSDKTNNFLKELTDYSFMDKLDNYLIADLSDGHYIDIRIKQGKDCTLNKRIEAKTFEELMKKTRVWCLENNK